MNIIDVNRLAAVKTLITHANCPDGVASALIVRDVLPDVEVKFVQYGTQEYRELPAKTNMMFVDIAPPEDRAHQFLECGTIVLDHHKTAWPVVSRFCDLGLGVFGSEQVDPGVSGAVLAHREVWKPLVYRGSGRVPNQATRANLTEFTAMLAGVRDTWMKDHAMWRAGCMQAEVLRFWPWDAWPRDLFESAETYDRMFVIGKTLIERNEKNVRDFIAQGKRITSARGTRMFVVPTRQTSDIADMVDDVDIVIGFSYMNDHDRLKMILSTRSRGSFDCRLFCEANGGGGHTKAAGCEVTLDVSDQQPYTMIEAMVDYFERTGLGIRHE